jgi:hypothetical protein
MGKHAQGRQAFQSSLEPIPRVANPVVQLETKRGAAKTVPLLFYAALSALSTSSLIAGNEIAFSADALPGLPRGVTCHAASCLPRR